MKFSLKNVFFGKSTPARRKARRRGFGRTESFESRLMLTAMVNQVGDVLQVEGTNNDDAIEISYADEAQTQVQAVVSDANGNVLASGQFNAANIDSIEVNSLDGDDDVRNNTNIESELNGNGGNDLLQGGTDDDDLNGGNGDDQKFDGDEDSIEREDGIVLVTGTNADDTIRVQYTDSSRDEIVITIKDADGNLLEEEDYSADSVDRIIVNGLNGDDYLRNDTRIGCELNGGNGIDLLVGGRSADVLRGWFGDDSLYGQSGDDVLQGEAGDDCIKGSYGNDLIDGGDGNDTIYGDRTYLTSFRAGDDVINGGDGNDTIRGGYGDDTLNGNDGRDTIIGERGNDTITGGNGNDLLYGDSDNLSDTQGGDDVISGNDGIDQLFGGVGDDTLDGGDGLWDVLYGMDGDDTLRGGAGTDYMYGGDGNDRLYGGSGRDFLRGQADDDDLDGGADGENDFLSGGTGADTMVDHYSLFFQNFRLRRVSEDTLDDYDGNEDTKIAKLKRFF